jgi:hypothetical protein
VKETTKVTPVVERKERPQYEAPRMQQMSEREILNSFQITQSMGGWWTNPTCC